MPRKIPETESMEEAYQSMLLVGPPTFSDRESLDDYVDVEGEIGDV